MPELPEVETIKETLQPLVGLKLANHLIYRVDMIKQNAFAPESIIGKRLISIKRRGKFLAFHFDKQQNLVFHLGMSGQLYSSSEKKEDQHIHYEAQFDNNAFLHFRDPRRFGGIWLVSDLEAFFSPLGPEPLTRAFNAGYLAGKTQNRTLPIKNLLLNQHIVAGIGNIYADEALFAAGVRPQRAAKELTLDEINSIAQAVKKVLKAGIKHRGTTFRDYRDGNLQTGNFQKHLKAYGRKDQPCIKCGNPLLNIRLGGRGTYYCPCCQS